MTLTTAADPLPLAVGDDGVARVAGSRIPLDTIIGSYLDGNSAEVIADQYPSLDLADVYALLSFYLKHRSEVDAYLKRRDEQARAVRRQNEARFNPEGVRERLLARRAERNS